MVSLTMGSTVSQFIPNNKPNDYKTNRAIIVWNPRHVLRFQTNPSTQFLVDPQLWNQNCKPNDCKATDRWKSCVHMHFFKFDDLTWIQRMMCHGVPLFLGSFFLCWKLGMAYFSGSHTIGTRTLGVRCKITQDRLALNSTWLFWNMLFFVDISFINPTGWGPQHSLSCLISGLTMVYGN